MAREPRGPGRWWYGVAALVFLTTLAGFTVFLIRDIGSMESSMTRLIVPGRTTLNLSERGTYTVFYEYQSTFENRVFATGEKVPGLECRVVSAEGPRVPLFRPSMHASYTYGGRSGFSVLDFRVEKPGNYEFGCDYPKGTEGSQAVFAIGRDVGAGIFRTVFVGIAIMFGGTGAAAAILVLIYRKRRKSLLPVQPVPSEPPLP